MRDLPHNSDTVFSLWICVCLTFTHSFSPVTTCMSYHVKNERKVVQGHLNPQALFFRGKLRNLRNRVWCLFQGRGGKAQRSEDRRREREYIRSQTYKRTFKTVS